MGAEKNMNTKENMNTEEKKVVMVIGAGRSGTSLNMQILEWLGCSVSEDTISVGIHNPRGAYEDEFICKSISSLFQYFKTDQFLGLPPDYLSNPFTKQLISKLANYIKEQTMSDALWAFKEPMSALVMDLWVRVFNKAAVTPYIILAVREPEATIHSHSHNFERSAQLSEYLWLNKYVSSIFSLGGYCFISHYENILTDPEGSVRSIACYIKEEEYFEDKLKKSSVQALCDKRLNRSIHNDIQLENDNVARFYEVLKGCVGEEFDKEALLAETNRIRNENKNHSAGIVAAHKLLGALGAGRQTKEKVNNKDKEIAKLVRQLSQQQKVIFEQTKKYEAVTADYYALKHQHKNAEKDKQFTLVNKPKNDLRNRISNFKKSSSFKLIAKAYKKPGINTVKLPFRLIKLLLMRSTRAFK